MTTAAPPELARIFEHVGDHRTWAEETLQVATKEGVEIPYRMQPAQLRLLEGVKKQRAQHRPIRIIYLKARQVMVSTATAGLFFYLTAFVDAARRARVVAHDKKAAGNIFGYYKLFRETYQPFRGAIHQPKLVGESTTRLTWENKSWIDVDTAENVRGGRSYTLHLLHLSEYAFYRDPRTLITGLMQSIPDSPSTAVIKESTANGIGNEFHRDWERAIDPAMEDDWLGLFFAWWEHPAYRTALPIAPEMFQNSLDREEQQLMDRHGLDLEQLAWRRWCIRNNCRSDVQVFRQEYPSNPEEAFQASGRAVFSFPHLRRMPVIRDGTVGRLEEQTDATKREIYFLPQETGELTIYRKPADGHAYVIGADPAQGIDATEGEGTPDPDWSVGQVLDLDSAEQVCKFRARVTPGEFAKHLNTLGAWYYWAFLVPEANGLGIATIEKLVEIGYPAHLLYQRRGSPQDLLNSGRINVQYLGWLTTTVSRPQLLSTLDTAIREMAITIRDPHTIQELRTFISKPDGRQEHQKGCHDDEVIALGLAVKGIQHYPQIERTRRSDLNKPAKKRRRDDEEHFRGYTYRVR